jgi:hypothetical protein
LRGTRQTDREPHPDGLFRPAGSVTDELASEDGGCYRWLGWMVQKKILAANVAFMEAFTTKLRDAG